MATFIADLRKKLEEASGQTPPWGDVNPLVMIGLTEAILDLGLNEDQIYSTVRSYGRQLAAQVHPDKQPANVSPERQRQILGAFDVLDNRENFTRALTHFRTLRAEDRRETRILQQSLSALRHQVSGFESQFEQLAIGKRQLSEAQQLYLRQKREEPILVPPLEAKIEELKVELKFAEDVIKQQGVNITMLTNRAQTAEYKVPSLERRFNDANAQLAEKRATVVKMRQALWAEKRKRKAAERTSSSMERNAIRWQRKFAKADSIVFKLKGRVAKLFASKKKGEAEKTSK